MADFVVAEHADFNIAERVRGTARIGIVGEAVLRAQFAVDLIEDDAKFAGIVWEEHGAARGFCDGLQSVLTGGVAAVFVFHGPNENSVNKRVRADGRFASSVKIGAAGGLAAVGDEDNDVTAFPLLRSEAARPENNRIIDGGSRAGRNLADSVLELGDAVGEFGDVRNVLVKTKDGEAIPGTNHLLNEMSGGSALLGHADLRAEAGVNHESNVERLLSFPFKHFDFLRITFFLNLKCFDGKVGGGPIIFVEDADENVDEVYFDFDGGAALDRVVVRFHSVRGLRSFSRCRFVFLRPGRAIGIILRPRETWNRHCEKAQICGGAEGCGQHW